MMKVHLIVNRVMAQHMDPPDWRRICDEQEAHEQETMRKDTDRMLLRLCDRPEYDEQEQPEGPLVPKMFDTMDWGAIDDEPAKPYWARNVLYAGANVSRRKPWYAKVDWDGVGWGFAAFLLAVLLVGCKSISPPTNAEYVATHHCVLTDHVDGSAGGEKFYDEKTGEFTSERRAGWSAYQCPDGRQVFVDDAQPPLPKVQP